MNTNQLQCAIESDSKMKDSIYGVFASDEISNIQLRPMSGLIANTDVKSLPGQHWIAFYLNTKETLEIFDSYGSSIDQLTLYFQQFLNRYSTIKANGKRLQSKESKVCGQYCLFYLMSRVRGHSMEDVIQTFGNNYSFNDQFVYNDIDERFHCCMTFVNDNCQSCTVCK